MVHARSRSFWRTIKGWLQRSLQWWLPHHCSVPPLPPATLVRLISELPRNTSSTPLPPKKPAFLSLSLPTSTMCYLPQHNQSPTMLNTHSMFQANYIAHTPVLEVMSLGHNKDLWGFTLASFVLSLEFGRRCRVRSHARCWLQLVGCAALLMDASNFGGPDGVGESGVEPRSSLRKTRAS